MNPSAPGSSSQTPPLPSSEVIEIVVDSGENAPDTPQVQNHAQLYKFINNFLHVMRNPFMMTATKQGIEWYFKWKHLRRSRGVTPVEPLDAMRSHPLWGLGGFGMLFGIDGFINLGKDIGIAKAKQRFQCNAVLNSWVAPVLVNSVETIATNAYSMFKQEYLTHEDNLELSHDAKPYFLGGLDSAMLATFIWSTAFYVLLLNIVPRLLYKKPSEGRLTSQQLVYNSGVSAIGGLLSNLAAQAFMTPVGTLRSRQMGYAHQGELLLFHQVVAKEHLSLRELWYPVVDSMPGTLMSGFWKGLITIACLELFPSEEDANL